MSIDTEDHGRIVVGIDGSECSRGALEWGMRQAELTRACVRAVVAWHWPVTFAAPMPDSYSPANDAERILEGILEPARKEYPDVPIDSKVLEGHPAPILIREAEDADLLVVGSRGHGGFVGMLLGSVGEHCVSHAPCPVLVFRCKHD